MSTTRIAVVGAGPAGIYAAHMVTQALPAASVDLLEKLPVPYGLVRYGVAPDHPRIKRIQVSLQEILQESSVRLLCHVEVGRDISIDELLRSYDAVILATGADRDADLDIPGIDLAGSFGAADFVAWYDSHPDSALDWPFQARTAAVIGAGNVALDVARVLAKQADDMLTTDVPDHVHAALGSSPLQDVHMFIRRGPVDVRFSPLELRELGEQRDLDVVVDPAHMVLDDHARRMVAQFTPKRQIIDTLTRWSERDPATMTASRRVHLHFYQAPVRLEGDATVATIVTERTEPDELGRVRGTGELTRTAVQAVYRAVGYASSPVPGVPFDARKRIVPNDEGRVLDVESRAIPGLYVTGWIKRGPVGLIGSTKSDARQTVENLVLDVAARANAEHPTRPDIEELMARRSIGVMSWQDWLRVDAAELTAGAERGRERIKIVTRADLIAASRA